VIVLDDFVMLGKTVPEPSSDGRIRVCSAGVSPTLRSLIRVYPLARWAAPKCWETCRVPLERNPKDSRRESYRLAADRTPEAHARINSAFEVTGTVKQRDWQHLLAPYAVGSIDEANKKRISLAILHPDSYDLNFEHNPESPDSPQLSLFDSEREQPQGAKRFPYIPRLRFRDDCRTWNLMLREWGCYELMRKNSHDYATRHMHGALHLNENSSLLVGNLNNQRNAWVVIKVINHIREQPNLFSALPDERPRISEKLRRQVYERDGWKCRLCGSPDNLQVDHVVPHNRGGQTKLENLQTLCGGCNRSKSDQIRGVA
jgi:hypothetical protein